jgi:hypothetical protein
LQRLRCHQQNANTEKGSQTGYLTDQCANEWRTAEWSINDGTGSYAQRVLPAASKTGSAYSTSSLTYR